MISNVKILKKFQAKAFAIACYVINISPSTTLNFKTPMEVWNGKALSN